MEIAEFVEETGKLEKFYDKELKPFEREIWYQQLKFLPISRYRQIVNKSFGECKFLPKLADILELHKQLPYKRENVQAKQNVKCDKCGGKGIFIYTKVLDNGANKIKYQYAARCNCENGQNYAYDGTKVSDARYRSKYYVPIAEKIGI